MSSTRARLALACCLCTAACGEPRLIGLACPPGGCPADEPLPGGCGTQLRSQRVHLLPGEGLDRCELFTLDALPPTGDEGQVYLTRAHVTLEPEHHLEVKLAPALGDFDDGEVECDRLYALAVPWAPLLTAQLGDEVDLSRAPLVAAISHRVLFNHWYVNNTDDPVDVSVVLNLECAATRPAVVSQAFEFSAREGLGQWVQPRAHVEVSASCGFQKDVLVSRLYRRTHLISTFSVATLGGPRNGELVWSSSGLESTLYLDPPRAVAADEGFSWTCTYDNDRDLAFKVGGDSPDTCALYGVYQLPGGGEDDSPERCIR